MSEVQIREVVKRYGETEALKDFTLDIPDGEFFALFGPSGAGKSTLLKSVAGIVEVDEGTIRLGDMVVNGLPPHRRNVALAFESYALYPHLTVHKNLEFPLKAPGRKLSATQRAARIQEVARLLEIDQLLERRSSQLSGGQRQRVSLGRALVRDANVTLLDEPLAHLDARLRNSLRSDLKEYQRRHGRSTIYTSPDYVEAFGIADRVAVLIDGRIEQVGTPEEVYGAPANLRVARLVGDPKMNLLEVGASRQFVLDGRSVQLPDVPRLQVASIGHVGIRPTDVEIATSPGDGAIEGVVYVAEPVGADQIVRVDVAGSIITAKVTLEREPFAIGQKVWIAPDWERAHPFDAEGTRIAA